MTDLGDSRVVLLAYELSMRREGKWRMSMLDSRQEHGASLRASERRVRDGSLTAGKLHYVSEDVFQGDVLRLAKQYGWMTYHT